MLGCTAVVAFVRFGRLAHFESVVDGTYTHRGGCYRRNHRHFMTALIVAIGCSHDRYIYIYITIFVGFPTRYFKLIVNLTLRGLASSFKVAPRTASCKDSLRLDHACRVVREKLRWAIAGESGISRV